MKILQYDNTDKKLYYDLTNLSIKQNINSGKDYLTFEALEDGTFTMTLDTKLPTTCVESVSYSIDNGKTWVTTNNVDNQVVTITTPTITQGNKVIWKGTAVQYCTNTDQYPGSNIGYGYFTSTNNFNVSGNIMSLLYNDDFDDKVILPTPITTGYGAGNFGYLFGNENCKIISAINLKLPATTLSQGCYKNMFNRCTSLVSAPTELPATTLAAQCYFGMFSGCTALTTAPKLPATTMASNCYNGMFHDCTALATAPALPATTLVESCYYGMFQGCTSLTIAPELPAITLISYCYNQMFKDCTNLNYIKAMFTTTPSGTYTDDWVSGVASVGTFVKNSAATWDVTSIDGIPSNWTVETANE